MTSGFGSPLLQVAACPPAARNQWWWHHSTTERTPFEPMGAARTAKRRQRVRLVLDGSHAVSPPSTLPLRLPLLNALPAFGLLCRLLVCLRCRSCSSWCDFGTTWFREWRSRLKSRKIQSGRQLHSGESLLKSVFRAGCDAVLHSHW